MDNLYLLQLIQETNTRGGGMVLNLNDQPSVVVLSIDRYNQMVKGVDQKNDNNDYNDNPLAQSMPKKKKSEKVLVTGGAGYIGGHLVNELIKQNYEVVVLDNLVTGLRDNVNPKAFFVEGDLADENLLADLFASSQFDAVFHMAASLEVGESVLQPEKYFQNNVVNTARLLKAMEEAGCKKIIFSSTAAVYGETQEIPLTETSSLHPNNPYGSSKLLCERLIKYYCEYLGFKAAVFRYFNACGFDTSAHILPTHQSHLIYNVLMVAKGQRQHLEVFGKDYATQDGTGVRDYVHVLDLVKPKILALEGLETANKFEVYNIGTGKGHSVLEVANASAEITGKIIPMEVVPRRAGDAATVVANNHKLKEKLGYTLAHSDLENMIKTSWEVIRQI